MVGKTLNQYRILDRLGQGGMGEVYVAEDPRLKRKIALKVLPPVMAKDPDRRTRFEREAQAVAALNHPNIVTIYSVEESDGVHFFTMELLDGQSLSEIVPESGLDLEKLFELAIPIADALATAHEQGITHRDLKPDNVMRTSRGRVKVLDFGLAKLGAEAPGADDATQLATATVTQEGKILGTVNYMSPEQAEGKPVDARSDVFSLGILLFEMATGQRPFEGDTAISTISSIIKDTPPSVSDVNRRLPRHLGRIINRCLDKDPERRYTSADEVRRELESLRAELVSGISSTNVTPPPVSTRTSRLPRLIALGAFIGVAVLVALFFWSRTGNGDPSAAGPGAVELPERSIAVLPFVDMSQTADQEYFSDGISEELINRLARVEGLRVAGRTSSFAFKGTQQDLRTIGGQLGVETVLEGSVRMAGDKVRITAQLVNADDGYQLWSETYDRELSDIFEVQDEIADRIVGVLSATLDTGRGGVAQPAAPPAAGLLEARRDTESIEAYRLYLQGRYQWQRRTAESLTQSIDLLERAIALDPNFARAHAGLAAAVWTAPNYTNNGYSESGIKAERSARDALALDPQLADAGAVLAAVLLARREWIAAEAEFQKAHRSEPENTLVMLWHGIMLLETGRVQAALEQFEAAYEVDPAWGVLNGWLGQTYRLLGDRERALSYLRSSQALGWGAADQTLFWMYLDFEMYDEALALGESMLRNVPEGTSVPEPAANLLRGIIEAARTGADHELSAASKVMRPGDLFQLYLLLDEPQLALEAIDAVSKEREGNIAGVLFQVWLDSAAALRQYPPFQAYLAEINLPDYWRTTSWPDACQPTADGVTCN